MLPVKQAPLRTTVTVPVKRRIDAIARALKMSTTAYLKRVISYHADVMTPKLAVAFEKSRPRPGREAR